MIFVRIFLAEDERDNESSSHEKPRDLPHVSVAPSGSEGKRKRARMARARDVYWT